MVTVKINRLWKGVASVRDYLVDKAVLNGEGVRLVLGSRIMTMTAQQVGERAFHTNKKMFTTKFGRRREYYLIDFKFVDDEESRQKEITSLV